MRLNYFYPIWGSSHLPLEEFCEKIKKAGYNGVEMNIPFDENYAKQLRELLPRYDLLLIAQQWLEPKDETPEEYVIRMERYLQYLTLFKPLFINSHTGKDFYSFEDNCKIFEAADKVCENLGVKIVHETHRGRALFSTVMAMQYFNVFPNLRINADFSHWCCVSESLLQDQNEIMSQAIERADYIHARVGYEQGPQVNHFLSGENKISLDAHLTWWKKIVEKVKQSGQKEMFICTEFGPEPYLQTLPFSNKPTVSQWELNTMMKQLLTQEIK